MSELRLFLPIGKIDEAKRLVYGVLTAEVPDKSGEIFDYLSGKPAVQAWSDEISASTKGKSKGNVRAMHGKTAAGKFTDIVYDDDNKRIEGAAKIVDDDEWEKVVEGVYTGFSIGGSYTKRWQDKDNPSLWRFTPELTEISLVDNPCVPTATFEYIKADGSREMRKFTPSHKEDSMDPKLLKAAQDAETAGTATDEQKALLAKAAADAAPAVRDGKPVKPATAPMQKWVASDGQAFDSKREAEVHNLEIEKLAQLAPGLAQMDALLKGAKKPADEEDDEDKDGDDEDTKAKKKERREKKAKEKAEKDDAEMAAKEEKEEKARKDKEEADKAAAAALQKKGRSGKATTNVTVSGLQKGLHQVGWLANLLSELQCLQGSVEFEQMFEQDKDSELPAKFKSLVSEMCEVLVALVDEETEELIEGDDTDVQILEMAAGLPEGHPEAVAKFARGKAEPLVKSDSKSESGVGAKLIAFAETLEKAGARHSKADAERVQKLHDHMDEMHKCMGDMAEKCVDMHKAAGEAKNTAIDLGAKGDKTDDEDDMEPSNKAASVKMSKLYEQLNSKTDEVLAVSKVAAASNETLLKAIPLIESLQKQIGGLEDEKSELAKRVDHLERQPGAAKGHVRAGSTVQDKTGADSAKADTQPAFKPKWGK